MDIRLNFKPFNLFWMDCQFNTLFSILTSMDKSYKVAALLNDYSYAIEQEYTPNNTWYNEVFVVNTVINGDVFRNKFFPQQTSLNFKHDENYIGLIKNYIKNNDVVMVGVDLFYWIPNSVCWNKHHWEHYSYINGFNDEKGVFYVFEENFYGFGEFEIPQDRMMKAIESSPLEPHAIIYKLCNAVDKYELSVSEVKSNAKRIIEEISRIIPIDFWILSEKDFTEGHMCDLISTQIFQIINRHIANQLLINELEDAIGNLQFKNELDKYCIELQDGWNQVKTKLVKIYYSNNRELMIHNLNKKCKDLFLKEIEMWDALLRYTN
ncbi:hypothetical protein [Ruminiclostridium papyrosolvens]|uniref:Butirosin biosynthesis protein H N-terminal domain-containing protein n=1 Tax=Ruminiclostridium papyrosolvens C7 TaxID=1330534 RepID=U4R5B3_9FIRM|nr:hypothetical protein [Ruminiclostridium papyrosolvens]EPR13617.1 hypothetical protein L323_03360 [Ruminiclostridium papyrosolvens C7]